MVLPFDVLNQVDLCANWGKCPIKRFFFESCWANDDECHHLVKSRWGPGVGPGSMRDVVSKIEVCVEVAHILAKVPPVAENRFYLEDYPPHVENSVLADKAM
ncbi:hypothetical protein QYF36_013141 [Acer negundo]|nr:hypothetical protein QYF36_013141 [Acer negundo]